MSVVDYVVKGGIIALSIVAIYFVGLPAIVAAAAFAIAQIIGIFLLKNKITDNLIKVIKQEAMGIKKAGGIILITTKKFRRDFDSFVGSLDLFTKMLWTHFAIVLVIFRYLSSEGSQVIQNLIVAIVVSVIIAIILAPFTLPYWLIYSTRVRILNPKDALIERVGKTLRMVYKSLFGFGNLTALLVLFIQVIRAAEDLSTALQAYLWLLALVFGSVSLGSLISTLVLYAARKEEISSMLDSFEESVKEYAASTEEALELLKSMVVEEEGKEIAEEAEEIEVPEEVTEVPEEEEGEEVEEIRAKESIELTSEEEEGEESDSEGDN